MFSIWLLLVFVFIIWHLGIYKQVHCILLSQLKMLVRHIQNITRGTKEADTHWCTLMRLSPYPKSRGIFGVVALENFKVI